MSLTILPPQKLPTLVAAIATTFILSLTAVGCASSPTTPAPVPDSVNGIIDLVPPLGTKLLHGQTVTFTGTAGYSLNSADSGQVLLAIEDQTNKRLSTTEPSATVAKGSGQVTLSQSITLPDTGVTAVQLYFLLVATGATSTHAAVPVTYQVQ
jgi:hypothetical protein